MTVTELGAFGSGLDHLVLTQPIFAKSTFLALMENPPRWNRIDLTMRFSLELGRIHLWPFSLPRAGIKEVLKGNTEIRNRLLKRYV